MTKSKVFLPVLIAKQGLKPGFEKTPNSVIYPQNALWKGDKHGLHFKALNKRVLI